jgi:hypothetical protein
MTEGLMTRWSFTAVHRDGRRERVLRGLHVPDPTILTPVVVSEALKEAFAGHAALDVDRVK